jgi:MATE family multidrug resistance protein
MTPVRRELRELWLLAWPLVMTQLGFMMLGVVDTLLLGHVSVEALGASALATMWGWGSLALGMGAVLGMDPLVSQAHGDRDEAAAALALQRGILVAVAMSIPVTAFWALTGPGLVLLGQDPAIAALAQTYNLIRAPSVVFFLVFTAMRSWLSGRGLVAPAMWVSVVVNVANLVLGWALIFGRLGLPRLELVGAAIVASLVVIVQPLLLWWLIRATRVHEGAWRPWDRRSFEWAGMAQILRLGLPVGLQFSLEGWAWSFSTMMAGWISTAALGGHIIVLNMASLSFQLPLGIALAAGVRVGNQIGAGDLPGARRSAAVSLALGAGAMAGFALLFALLAAELPLLYTTDAAVIALGTGVLPIAGAFQIFDGTQVVAGGILRGAGRTHAAAYVNLIGFWGIALPLAWLWAFHNGGGLEGIWWGLVAGLAAVSTALVFWVQRTTQRPIEELRVGVR